MNAIRVHFLIDPESHEVAAILTEENENKKIELRDIGLAQRLSHNGITVPKGFIEGKWRIFPPGKLHENF